MSCVVSGSFARVVHMKKPVLAMGVAATLAAGSMVAPPGMSVVGAAEVGAGGVDKRGLEGSSSEGDGLSPGAIVAIVLGVLAAVSAAGVAALQQGLIELPNMPKGPAPQASAGAPKRGSCDAGAFDRLVPGWPAGFGTQVDFCDGQWAVAGAKGTDWIMYFRYVGDRWTVVPSSGTKQSGMKRACYNGITLREQGAPEEFVRRAPICTPAEIGK